MCDFHIFIDIFDDISPFHHFIHFFVNFFFVWCGGGCGGVAGLHRKVFIFSHERIIIHKKIQEHNVSSFINILIYYIYIYTHT